MESTDTFDQITQVSMAVQTFCENYPEHDGWITSYKAAAQENYDKIKNLLKAEPNNRELLSLQKTLDDKIKDLDQLALEVGLSADQHHEPENIHIPPQVRRDVQGVRLLSESTEDFLDMGSESNMVAE